MAPALTQSSLPLNIGGDRRNLDWLGFTAGTLHAAIFRIGRRREARQARA
jgi:hypothetical protein